MYGRAATNLGYDRIVLTAAGASGLPFIANATGGQLGANAALIRIESGEARFLMDGSSPTTTGGFPIFATDTAPLWLWGNGILRNFQAISTSGTVTLDVLYFAAGMM
jgi:hypothetical protein